MWKNWAEVKTAGHCDGSHMREQCFVFEWSVQSKSTVYKAVTVTVTELAMTHSPQLNELNQILIWTTNNSWETTWREAGGKEQEVTHIATMVAPITLRPFDESDETSLRLESVYSDMFLFMEGIFILPALFPVFLI